MSRRALIFGVGGQDGAYLARALLDRGYAVHGTTRGAPTGIDNLRRLAVEDRVTVHRADPCEPQGVDALLERVAPDEIYYLAAQSSVWRSFLDPAECLRVSAVGLVNVLEAARRATPQARILNAASGDCFGETEPGAPATETSAFAPRSPYAAAKCAGHHALAVARLAHRQFACSAFLFSHESPLRGEDFAVGKILAAARRIAAGSDERLELGNVAVVRDWGWAPDHVEAIRGMLALERPEDLVIATGRSHSLAEVAEGIFAAFGLDWSDHVEAGAAPPRPTDIARQHADPARARDALGWTPLADLGELCRRLAAAP